MLPRSRRFQLPTPPNRSLVQFHAGMALCRLADDYATLAEVIYEQGQNAIDAQATRIWIEVYQKSHLVIIRDNGCGTDKEDFDRALQSVCMTLKSENDTAYGQFGQGLISPLRKCGQNTFTSRKRDSGKPFTRWTFVTADIEQMREQVIVPNKVVRGDEAVPWNTEVRLIDTTTDGVKGRLSLESLVENIIDRFNVMLLERPVWVEIKFSDADGHVEERKFTGRKFFGEKLREVSISREKSGDTLFRMFIAPKSERGRKGTVQVGVIGNPYRFTLKQCLKSIPSGWIMPEAVEVLTSGLFEGEILGRNIQLHVSRKQFVENETLCEWCDTLNEWYATVGREYFAQIQADRQDERYQDIGLRTIQKLASLLKNNERFAGLMRVINSFSLGNVGPCHVPPSKRNVAGDTTTATSLTGQPGTPRGDRKEGGGDRPDPKTEKDGHHPFVVAGPKGSERKLVKHGSLGLMFRTSMMAGSPRLYELDVQTGILDFNDRHPHWQLCAGKDEHLARLELFCAIQALTLETLPAETREWNQLAFDEQMGPIIEAMIVAGHTITGKKPGRKKNTE